MDLNEHLDRHVELEGTAYDAHAGAILDVGGTPVYLAGVERWPKGRYGTPATVAGVLRRRRLTPEPQREPPSHGISGAVFVLEDPRSDSLACD